MVVLMIVILLPLAGYFLLRTGENFYKKLEIVGERNPVVNATGGVDTVYHTIYDSYPDFRFATQRGDTLTWDSLRGKIIVANVFFSNCKGPCPKLSSMMSQIAAFVKSQESTQAAKDIRFLSISVDPANDSVARLKEYAAIYNADPARWYFITGEKEKLYKLAMDAFYFQAEYTDSNGVPLFIHDEHLRLIDPDGRIRKGDHFIDGTNPGDMQFMKDELKLLLDEYKQK